jgi:hypothetical protein
VTKNTRGHVHLWSTECFHNLSADFFNWQNLLFKYLSRYQLFILKVYNFFMVKVKFDPIIYKW